MPQANREFAWGVQFCAIKNFFKYFSNKLVYVIIYVPVIPGLEKERG